MFEGQTGGGGDVSDAACSLQSLHNGIAANCRVPALCYLTSAHILLFAKYFERKLDCNVVS